MPAKTQESFKPICQKNLDLISQKMQHYHGYGREHFQKKRSDDNFEKWHRKSQNSDIIDTKDKKQLKNNEPSSGRQITETSQTSPEMTKQDSLYPKKRSKQTTQQLKLSKKKQKEVSLSAWRQKSVSRPRHLQQQQQQPIHFGSLRESLSIVASNNNQSIQEFAGLENGPELKDEAGERQGHWLVRQ